MKYKIAILFIVSFSLYVFLIGFGTSLDQQVIVEDTSKKEVIILRKNPSQKYIHSIKINISGNVKGQSVISLILNNEPYKTKTLDGNFSFSWSGDWYSDIAEIIYQPIHVKDGDVIIRYEFESLRYR